jgi:GNAT superfamily N-acetyltransferase
LQIRPAAAADAPVLTDLAMRAKAHWGYAAGVLDSWRSELTIAPQDILARPTFVAAIGGEIAGFYALSPRARTCELAHLWVSPRFMRRGVGRALVEHARATAAQGGAVELTADADPNAEAFYLGCGAQSRGAVPAPIPGQPERVRPQLVFPGKGV